MKPYGNKRTENVTCRYGCCTRGTVKTRHRPFVDEAFLRRSRKRARQAGKVTSDQG